MAGPGAQLYFFPTDFFVPPLHSSYDLSPHRESRLPRKDLPLNVSKRSDSKIERASGTTGGDVVADTFQAKEEKLKKTLALKIDERKLGRARIAPLTMVNKRYIQHQERISSRYDVLHPNSKQTTRVSYKHD